MPTNWRIMMIVICLVLAASVIIGTYRLATTPTEILGDGFHGIQKQEFPK
jgi:hypothetical protein